MTNPPSGPINLKKGDLLFDDGAPSDAMYVVKSGCIAIVKKKGKNEIELAKVMPGQLFGEMAFFDDKPRSAGARATKDTVVIALPFSQLHAQFRQFPEWLKAMVKTVNDNLRNANKRIKELEQSGALAEKKFPPHTITKLSAIFSLVARQFHELENDLPILSWNVLRRYTIQIFQEPTNKMEKLLEVFVERGLCEVEKLGEGRRKIIIKDLDFIQSFVDFYNKYLFEKEENRVTITREEIPILKAIIYYGEKAGTNDKGIATIQLDQIRQDSVKDLDYLVDIHDYESLMEKKIMEDKVQEESGISSSFHLEEVKQLTPYWELIFAIQDKDPVKD